MKGLPNEENSSTVVDVVLGAQAWVLWKGEDNCKSATHIFSISLLGLFLLNIVYIPDVLYCYSIGLFPQYSNNIPTTCILSITISQIIYWSHIIKHSIF